MRLIYDIDRSEQTIRESFKLARTQALESTHTPRDRRLAEAQIEMAEATIAQVRETLRLLNEGVDVADIAQVLGVALGNAAWFLIKLSPDPRQIIDVLMDRLIDPGSLAHLQADLPASIVMGGRA